MPEHVGQTAIYVSLETRNRLSEIRASMEKFALETGLRKRPTGIVISYGDIIEALVAYVDLDDLADRLQGLGLK